MMPTPTPAVKLAEELTADDLADLISLSEAAALLPSPRRGKKTNQATIFRKVQDGTLQGFRRGPYTFVRRSELPKLFSAVQTKQPRGASRRSPRTARQRELVRQRLEKLGCRVPPEV